MRKLIVSLITLGLLGSGAVYLTSCAKQAGPLSPSINTLGAANSANKSLPVVSNMSLPGSASEFAEVIFNQPMDASSFVKQSTVIVYSTIDTLTETAYTAYSLSYNATAKTLRITPDNNQWTNDRRYHVVLTTGVRNIHGSQLDGNANAIAERNEFDHRDFDFAVGTSVAPAYNSSALRILAMSLADYNGTHPWTGDLGNVDVAHYQYVTATVQFSETIAANIPNSTTLPSYISVTTVNGSGVSPVDVRTITTSVADDTLQMVFNLQPDTKYVCRLSAGINGPRTSLDATATLNRGRYLRIDSAAAMENEYVDPLYVQTGSASGTPIPSLYVTSSSYDSTLRRVSVYFGIRNGAGTETLDAGSVNASNFKMIDDGKDSVIVLSGMEVNNTVPGAPVVYLYVPMHFVNASTGNRTVKVWVSRDVLASGGIKMDQDGLGVTGTADDEYNWDHTIYNY